MVEEAIYQVAQDDEKEVSRQAEKIHEILISDDPETELEKYYLTFLEGMLTASKDYQKDLIK